MIDLIFNYASEVIIVRIDGHQVTFGSTMFGAKMASIEGLKLDFNSTIRRFPDLKDNINWKKEAIERFREHIRTLDKESTIADYVIYELRQIGYIPKLKQVAGMRPQRIQ